MTDWPPSMIEDYLSIRDNFLVVTEEVDRKLDASRITYNVTTTPYTVPDDADVVFVNTDGGDIVLNLPAGTEGVTLRLIDTGVSGNVAYPTPDGAELLFGVNSAEPLYDYEVFIISYSDTYGWF